ncbi:MAG TPA: hypothetical protein PK771_14335, partial [Spirochaetota bacterium]|nr:hypothetical protein [Spirochaetota bacterium]
MIDIEKIKKDYEDLKLRSYSRLLPLEKVLSLEEDKEELKEGYLEKITKITEKFELINESGF